MKENEIWRENQRGGMARKRAVPSFSFSRRAHLLTTCPQGRWWYPSWWSGRALSEGERGLRFLRKAPDDAGDAPLVRGGRHFRHCETSPQAGRGNTFFHWKCSPPGCQICRQQV